MSLENALAANTAAVLALTAALAGAALPGNEAPKKARGRPVPGEAQPSTPAQEQAAPAAVVPAQVQTAAPVVAQTAPASPAGEAPTFKQAADALVKLAETVSRDAAVGLLSKFGATKAPEIKPGDFAAFIAEANAQIAAKQAPAAGAAGLV